MTLTSPTKAFEEILLVKISKQDEKKTALPQEEDSSENIGLPELRRVFEKDWPALEGKGISMNYDKVMCPVAEGDKLEVIYVNLDSKVFLSHRSKLKSEEQILLAQKKYLSSVYFHALFLYMITKRRLYTISETKEGKQNDVTVDEYIRDVFDSYYSDFLLNFGMEQLINSLGD